MKFFEIYEILNSIVLSVFSGILFGGIFSASESILVFVKRMFFLLPAALGFLPDISIKKFPLYLSNRKKTAFNGIERNIFEAVMFSFFGIAMILVSYITLDGYIRAYVFFVAVLFFFLSYKYIGKIFSSVFERIFGGIYCISVYLLSLFFYPLYKITVKFLALAKKICTPLINFAGKRRYSMLLKRKIKEIERFAAQNT